MTTPPFSPAGQTSTASTGSRKFNLQHGWQPNRLLQSRAWLPLIGVPALLTYGFFGISLDSLPEKAAQLAILCGLLMLAIYGRPQHGVSLRRSGILWLAIAAIVVALISWGCSWLTHPQWAESSFKVHRLTNWFAMIPVAILLGGSARNAGVLWLAALCGLLLSPWISGGGWQEWQQGLSGNRVDFGLHNAQHTAMLFGTAALGLLAFATDILRSRRGGWVVRAVWLLALTICITALLLTQTRGVWAGMLFALLVIACAGVVVVHKYFHNHRRYLLAATLAVCGAATLVGYLSIGDIVSQRLEAEQNTMLQVQQGNFDNLPLTSTGIRLRTWAEALDWIAERPLVGWGGNGRSLIFDHSEHLPPAIKENFGHLHNSYLDLLVNFGLLGLLLLGALVYWLVSRCLRYYRAGLISGSTLTFCLSFTVFFAIVNLFESYLFYDSGRYVLALVGGGLLTQIWAAKRRQAAANTPR
ncbi:O-antigen ligase family protein [Microbulbifer salipaludis]|uniref:O-antigen ligase family protein n=1 Tax=Microbulbifer salipaludis TaxID=187980 RepID=A0ABS3E4G4_9GAMM|nr:O-antigen ligase family protein [Microbulbifer salipaludis]MBN8430142.1 O-antigen ligase family protein [Microbulbifer salipaludis]